MPPTGPTEEDIAWFKSTFHPIPKPALPDDCVEYSLYLISPELDPANDSEVRLRLRDIQKHASELTKKLLKDYIWQREGFGLELVREEGLSLLRGRTEYGDSVEDEWVVVYLLRELTKKFEDLWVKVKDSDGEFLLIEAAGTIPEWLEPEVAENRVWIHKGGLVIIKPQHDGKRSKLTTEKLALLDARNITLSEPRRMLRSAIIEEEAFYRLRNYPKQIDENVHHTLVTLPRKIAYLLHQKPAYISPAVESFYLRDPIALKPLQATSPFDLIFRPEDLVTTSVGFPRVSFAQLRSQDFPIPNTWLGKISTKSESREYSRAEIGMKLSCGFEMLVSDSQNQDKAAVREIKMLLEDIETGDERLPSNEEIAKWDRREDDEKWLDISFEDLEGELAGGNKKTKSAEGTKKGGDFGDKAAQENLQRIVAQFEKFLNDDSAGAEGANIFNDDGDSEDLDDDDEEDISDDDDPGEDKDASFDEDEFTAMMREMMGMPRGVMQEMMTQGKTMAAAAAASPSSSRQPAGNRKVEELSDNEDDDDDEEGGEDMQTLMKRMEDELNETGALDLDPTPRKISAVRDTKGKGKASMPAVAEENLEGEDEDEREGIDLNLARNLLESFKSQAGTAGPGGNLMGLMGGRMPRDEEESTGSGKQSR